MTNPQTPAGAANRAPPPVLNLPWGQLRADGQVYLTITSLEFLQMLWSSVQGTGGVIDTMNATRLGRAEIEGIVFGLITAIGETSRFKAPPPNLAAVRKAAEDGERLASRRPRAQQPMPDAPALARRPRTQPPLPDAPALARRPRLAPQTPDTSLITRRARPALLVPDNGLLTRRTRLQPAPSLPRPTFAQLPPNPQDGDRNYIIDGSVVALGNFGTAAAGGGTNRLPVFFDSGTTTWRVG